MREMSIDFYTSKQKYLYYIYRPQMFQISHSRSLQAAYTSIYESIKQCSYIHIYVQLEIYVYVYIYSYQNIFTPLAFIGLCTPIGISG